ncbi:MAG: F0F1 ATP synthase subunit gamma [Hyphomicrobiales bacterium]|nr:MAG: F0F1 ATP synthase subunit gamma [Hyphomicrobiales bacterium]
MASLKDLRNRIASVKATQKITKAMQMVAAAKLRRAQLAAESARPYSQRMDAVMANISAAVAGSDGAPKLLAGTGSDQKHLLIVATAERGLCGGFNSSIARLARDKARELRAAGKDVQMLCIGKKGLDVLKSEFKDILLPFINMREVKHLAYSDATPISDRILAMFEAEEFDVATLFYSEFQSIISQIPTALQIIPPQIAETEGEAVSASTIYDYEPDEAEILDDLLPRNVTVQIFRALLENGASEQGARMSAMDNATRNAGEMIDKLTLTFNRRRQAQITTELIEIIAGAEAL